MSYPTLRETIKAEQRRVLHKNQGSVTKLSAIWCVKDIMSDLFSPTTAYSSEATCSDSKFRHDE